MNILLGIIVGLIILTLLVVIHEYGHFILARKNGVEVNEFAIGFPPRAIAWVKKNGRWQKLPRSEWGKPQSSLIISINWLPIGGFCALKGETASDQRKGSFGKANFFQKTKILFGGAIFNWLTAFIILFLLALTGMPKFLPNQFSISSDTVHTPGKIIITQVQPDSPAALSGIQASDQISKINHQPVTSIAEVNQINQKHAGESVEYEIIRDNTPKIFTVRLNPTGKSYLLGIIMAETLSYNRSTWSAPIVALGTTLQLTYETFKGLGTMLWQLTSGLFRQISLNPETRLAGQNDLNQAGKSVSGPVGIVGVIFPAFLSAGLTSLAFLTVIISISLACMNVLPIPALDGGRWLLIAIYRLRKKPLDQATETKIVGRAFVFLIGLIFFITIIDLLRLL